MFTHPPSPLGRHSVQKDRGIGSSAAALNLQLKERRREHARDARAGGRRAARGLRSYNSGDVRRFVIGAFREVSKDVHMLANATADAAKLTHWREAGATSAKAARSTYVAHYRRRWGCTAAVGGARLRIARASLVLGEAPPPPAAAGGFDPGDHADFARAGAHQFDGPPRGQVRA